ncbi:unnamed protein product [Adineta steineri]|uniref:C3H1-type domain-containing protein n=1 Tax=Adineta steineri TaxID=433720 RepID=A0A815REM6_9BILA|nr:unnamed protein product [Adineta steineri]CAF4058207.1 unnamed protein product [Adineta steineri]
MWYQTEMTKYKPDIMQFIGNLEHITFRYRWNAKMWLDEFQRSAPHPRNNGNDHAALSRHKGTKPDNTRHLLRMTVMLNTLAVIREKSYMIGDRKVPLWLDNKLETIIYDHNSKLEQCETMPFSKTLYKETTVRVVREDCLVVYEDLVKQNFRPLLLNMANKTTPGGGYRKGDGAQEENLFRRSNYFQSLDIELDEYFGEQSERYHCTSDCRLNRIDNQKRIYPMDDFGAIYTSGLTVFRQSEEQGYAYMNEPLENVCAVAMAAYREPRLEGNMFAPLYAVGTRKKIENIFAIAYHHKHDSLVLSALGCGAFKNPPDHVAQLFLSVIEQYAGFFKSFVFAVIDDHNTGHDLNREGNFKPFQVLDGKIVKPVKQINIPNTMIGPYRFLSDGHTISDVCIFDSYPCENGAKCNEIHDPNHAHEFSHPPLCNMSSDSGNCPRSDNKVHMHSFIHRNRCQHGGECRKIDNEKHRQEFEHPSFCSKGNNCQDMDAEHLREYRHLPLCPESYKCKDYQKNVKHHCDSYRHCRSTCPYGNHCTNFHDTKHLTELQHPFSSPCPFTPYHCYFHNELIKASKNSSLSSAAEQHFERFSHVCSHGRNCEDTRPQHLKNFIHIARKICPDGPSCDKLSQEDHLNSLTHPNILDIRCLCETTNCDSRNDRKHMIKYRHTIRSDDMEIVDYYDMNDNIDFVRNQKDSNARIKHYFERQRSIPLIATTNTDEIARWLRTVQPVYRCNQVIFELILFHQYVMSQDYMKNLQNPKFLVDLVLQHNRIQRIESLKGNSIEKDVREYIIALIEEKYGKNNSGDSNLLTKLRDNRRKMRSNLSSSISEGDIEKLNDIIKIVADLSFQLQSNQFFRQDKTIYSTLGSHLDERYGDIFIVFKREILHHPDANFSIQTAASFTNGQTFDRCSWFGPRPNTINERSELYNQSKLHASIPGYEYAAALQLIATTSCSLNISPKSIDLQTILYDWTQTHSYEGIEANLPPLIPISYIDRIYIPLEIFRLLSSDAHSLIDSFFKDRITAIPYDGTTNPQMRPHGSQSKFRAIYQETVIKQLNARFSQRDEHSIARPIQGFVMTIPPSGFTKHILLPLTISQAFAQYRTDLSASSRDNTTFIYWQVMNGDMMLTLSSQSNVSGNTPMKSRCFICYIAEKPTASGDSYQEDASYLNSGSPSLHTTYVSSSNYAASSNTFYIGCNTDNFMTFCLEVQRSTGKITLSHAGPNSLYNRSTASYTFGKTELDLPTLDFIRVSAGDQPVPIRNLMICFEKQTGLHPTADTQFIDSVPAQRNPRAINQGRNIDNRILCRWGKDCRDIRDPEHYNKYSHPLPANQEHGSRFDSAKKSKFSMMGNTTQNNANF